MKNTTAGEDFFAVLKRAFSEFLFIPSVIIILFIGLAYFSYSIDHAKIDWLQPARLFLKQHIFSNSQSTSSLLGAIVSGIISVTTLTATLLLVIVQQSAGSMTAQVFDQFLRRKTNQFYLGFFVGLALYCMITLATVNEPFNPVFGGTISFSLTTVALYLLVLLMYTTIDQMRPSQIIDAIYKRILKARKKQLHMLEHTTDKIPFEKVNSHKIMCDSVGFLNKIKTKVISQYIHENCSNVYVIFNATIGTYININEPVAEIIYKDETDITGLKKLLIKNIEITTQRDIDFDAAYGIEQLETIAWTSSSTAKSNPAPGILCTHVMHNILSCWLNEKEVKKDSNSVIVYKDNAMEELMRGFENLAVVSSESMQHQIFNGVLNTISSSMAFAPQQLQARMEKLILIILSVMGDHVFTTSMETALNTLTDKLKALHKTTTASAVQEAADKLKASVGKLNSRSTRV